MMLDCNLFYLVTYSRAKYTLKIDTCQITTKSFGFADLESRTENELVSLEALQLSFTSNAWIRNVSFDLSIAPSFWSEIVSQIQSTKNDATLEKCGICSSLKFPATDMRQPGCSDELVAANLTSPLRFPRIPSRPIIQVAAQDSPIIGALVTIMRTCVARARERERERERRKICSSTFSSPSTSSPLSSSSTSLIPLPYEIAEQKFSCPVYISVASQLCSHLYYWIRIDRRLGILVVEIVVKISGLLSLAAARSSLKRSRSALLPGRSIFTCETRQISIRRQKNTTTTIGQYSRKHF